MSVPPVPPAKRKHKSHKRSQATGLRLPSKGSQDHVTKGDPNLEGSWPAGSSSAEEGEEEGELSDDEEVEEPEQVSQNRLCSLDLAPKILSTAFQKLQLLGMYTVRG